MPDITTNSPPDPAVAELLQEIELHTHDTEKDIADLAPILERLIEAVEEITKR